ncbi:MAG: hypothetical protein HPY83_17525 [Anaerolineae bacterium]|nr:hypothetical protein [Anaerolineae bacterium]
MACALGLGLRLHRLGAESLWYDETVSAHLAAFPPAQAVQRTALDIHPPGYYLALGLWADADGTSEFALAFFSCLLGVALIALTYALARPVGGGAAAALAAALSALSAYSVWYSQEVRMYTLAAALACLLLLITTRMASGPSPWWPIWGVVAAGALYTLYYTLFLLPALSLYWLVHACQAQRDRAGALARWAGAHLLALLLYLPWLPIAIRQALDPPVPPWRSPLVWTEALRQGAAALALGEAAPLRWWPLAAALVVVALLAPWARHVRRTEALLLASAFALPWAFIILISLAQPLFHPRYLFPYSPFFLSSLAVTLRAFGPHRSKRYVASALALVFVVGNAMSLDRGWTQPEFRADDLRGAVGELAESWVPGDVILVNAGYTYTALEHYWPGEIAWMGRVIDYSGAGAAAGPVILQGGSLSANPGLGWGRPESDFYATTLEQMVAGVERALAANRRLWVFRLYDTVTDPDGLLREWLSQSLIQTEDRAIPGPSFGRLQAFVPLLAELPCAEPVEWEGLILTCVEVSSESPAERIPVYLYAAPGPLEASGSEPSSGQTLHYTVRLTLPSGDTIGQTDGRVALRERAAVLNSVALELPPEAPPGEYAVQLGVYTLSQGSWHSLQPSLGGRPMDSPAGLAEVGRVTIGP